MDGDNNFVRELQKEIIKIKLMEMIKNIKKIR